MDEARRELERLERIAILLSSDPQLRQGAQHLATRLCAEADVETCCILAYDAGSRVLEEAGTGTSANPEVVRRMTGSRAPLRAGGWVERAFRQETVLVANHAEGDPRIESDLQRVLSAHTLLTAPLRFEGEFVGVMHLVNKRGGDFGPDDVRLAQLISPQVAAVVSSSQRYGEANEVLLQRLEEQRTLVDASLALTSTLELDAVLATLAERMTELPLVAACRIALFDSESGLLTVRAARDRTRTGDPGLGHSFDHRVSPWHRRAVEERGPVVVQRARTAEWGQQGSGTDWLLLLPLMVGDRVLGVISVGESAGEANDPFSPERIAFYQIMATQAALAIEKARLFAELQSSEQSFRELFENANDVIYIHDFEGRMLAANNRAVESFGYPAEELMGLTLDRLLTPQSMLIAQAEMERIAAGGEARGMYEIEALRRDGTTMPLEVSLRAIHRDGRPYGVQGIGRDLTERRRMEEQLLRTERLRALGELSAGVAHDFNNVLAGILGRTQLLLNKARETEIRRGLETIEQAAKDGAQMIRRIQGFARPDPDRRLETVDLVKVTRDALEMTRARWRDEAHREGVDVRVETALKEVPPVAGLASELREVLVNLINNAVDAMPRGGTLRLSSRTEGQTATLEVSDEGGGIPAEALPRIFDPFFTTKGSAGTGLGLSVCHQIVTAHGGELTVATQPGHGTTFTVRLPAGVGEPPADRRRTPAARGRRLRVLAVDDEPVMRDLLARLLVDLGHDVTAVSSGVEALREAVGSRFDLVLTDLGMPELNGWELATRLKVADPSLHIALVTGWGGQLDEAQLARSDIDTVLAKPFQIEDLAALVAQVAERRRRSGAAGARAAAPAGTARRARPS